MYRVCIFVFFLYFELNLLFFFVAVLLTVLLSRPFDELLDWISFFTDERMEVPIGDRNPDDYCKNHFEAPIDEECLLKSESAIQGRTNNGPYNEAEACHGLQQADQRLFLLWVVIRRNSEAGGLDEGGSQTLEEAQNESKYKDVHPALHGFNEPEAHESDSHYSYPSREQIFVTNSIDSLSD